MQVRFFPPFLPLTFLFLAQVPGYAQTDTTPHSWAAPRVASKLNRFPIRATSPLPRGGNYGKLPLSFEANEGQADTSFKFLAHAAGYTLFVSSGAAVFAGRDGSVQRMK